MPVSVMKIRDLHMCKAQNNIPAHKTRHRGRHRKSTTV
ncbi:unnamed protein product [Arabidopsis halleri]